MPTWFPSDVPNGGLRAYPCHGVSMTAQPGDSVQIGADLIKPVGDYDVPNAFRGTISNLSLSFAR